MNQENKMASEPVTVVTVTYGDRKILLRQVLDALRDVNNVERVLVVDNGATWDVKSDLITLYQDWVEVVVMGKNTGSATGFVAGMRRAIEIGAELIWLLDDDNCPEPNTLEILYEHYLHESSVVDASLLAVGVFRPVGQTGIVPSRFTPRHSSYCGFHVIDIPRKIIKRTPMRRLLRHPTLPSTIDVGVAAYSGLLFSKELLQRVGFPKEDFVLYCDDYEWTRRITAQGGKVLLVTRAIVMDLQSTWGGAHGNSLLSFLHGRGDATAYYAMRNEVFFYSTLWRKSRYMYFLNQAIFTSLLWLIGKSTGREARLGLLRKAARDGMTGKLGMNPEFPL